MHPLSDLSSTVLVLGVLVLAPFVLMMTTSFLKFAVVLSILRNAMGSQGIPPTPVVMGIATVLTVYVMAPVGAEIMVVVRSSEVTEGGQVSLRPSIERVVTQAAEPLRAFLAQHAHPSERRFFHRLAQRMGPATWSKQLQDDAFLILLPAFMVSELKEAFQIGFLVFLPFLVIDMVVSSILLAMGMYMLPPVVVSLPFKLLLFIAIDGWDLLIQGLLRGYA